jgi:hypothetical protein
MITFRIPIEAGNAAIRDGRIAKVLEQFMTEMKPEAAYFYPDQGLRGGHFIVNLNESSEIISALERLFLGLKASVEMVPVMSAEDLQKGMGSIEAIAKAYA